jgi:hypothetical protein
VTYKRQTRCIQQRTGKTSPRVLRNNRDRPVFWLAVVLPGPAFPCIAQWRSNQVVRLTAAGAAPDWREMLISRVTGFPFHPPADKQEGTVHLIGGDSTGNNA